MLEQKLNEWNNSLDRIESEIETGKQQGIIVDIQKKFTTIQNHLLCTDTDNGITNSKLASQIMSTWDEDERKLRGFKGNLPTWAWIKISDMDLYEYNRHENNDTPNQYKNTEIKLGSTLVRSATIVAQLNRSKGNKNPMRGMDNNPEKERPKKRTTKEDTMDLS